MTAMRIDRWHLKETLVILIETELKPFSHRYTGPCDTLSSTDDLSC